MDAITLLRNDHKTVEALFKRFEQAGDTAYVEKRSIVDRIIEELSVHAAIEEQVFYPAARAKVPDTEDIALESLEEHHIVKWVLSELDGLDPRAERFDAKVTVLIENVRHHVEEEQTEFFPKVRDALGRKELAELGEALAAAKKSAPTHPHPRSPDTPPGNVVGTIAGVVDRLSDNVSGIAQGGLAAGQDLVARITGAKRPKTSPTGSSAARGAAKSTRAAATAAGSGVRDTARSVSKAVSSTASAGRAGVKGTATSAKKAVGSTATTAKRATTTTSRTAKASTRRAVKTAKSAVAKTTAAAKR